MWRWPSHSPFLWTLRSSVAASARVMVGFLWVDTQVLWYRSHSEPAGQQWMRSEQQMAWKKKKIFAINDCVKVRTQPQQILHFLPRAALLGLYCNYLHLWVFVLSVTEKLLSRAQVKDTEEYPCLDFAVFLANYPSFWSTVQLILVFQSNDYFIYCNIVAFLSTLYWEFQRKTTKRKS